jgi:GNAT superfamily N-acetyltransferase
LAQNINKTSTMFADPALARRIERAEALNFSGCGESMETCGGIAVFAGEGSPLTHAVGLGMSGPVDPADFERMENFFRERGAPVNVEICAHASLSIAGEMGARGYRIVEWSNVLAGPVIGAADSRVRVADPGEEPLWTQTLFEGFFERSGLTEIERDAGRRLFSLDGAQCWFGISEGTVAAAGAMNKREGLAMLFADSTLARFRGRGLHLALIRARLEAAARMGCDWATATTAPGSISQRNYERAGFRVVYSKVNMQRDWS